MGEWQNFKPTRLIPFPITTETTLCNKTGLWSYVSPRYVENDTPCQTSCPAGQDIRGCIGLMREGNVEEASALIRANSPLPATCGRVCYHPCEDSCNRGEFDQAIAIHEIERFLGDFGLTSSAPSAKKADKKAEVAVVGSGPAGLSCAWRLYQLGHRVSIFEAESVPGGMLTTAIPDYRLPKEIVRKEIDLITNSGVEIITGVRIGHHMSLEDLFQKGYKAVFLAIGAQNSQKLNIPGEQAKGVTAGLEFLKEAKLGKKNQSLGAKVAVIGGGNVAIDVARTALRLGSKEVLILYRRSAEEMPASKEEVHSAKAEGVKIQYLVSPTEVIQSNGEVKGIKLVRMELSEPDASGRKRPVPVSGSEFDIQVDSVIPAISQAVDMEVLGDRSTVKTSEGLFSVDEVTLTTSRLGVFAGGDAVTGPATVTEAIGAGKKAAVSIDRYLKGITLEVGATEEKPVRFQDINTAYFEPAQRVLAREVPLDQRVNSFAEVNMGYKGEEALTEAERCFNCGHCIACDNCWLVCPEFAVSKEGKEYRIDYDYCKGCGICVQECPRSAITI